LNQEVLLPSRKICQRLFLENNTLVKRSFIIILVITIGCAVVVYFTFNNWIHSNLDSVDVRHTNFLEVLIGLVTMLTIVEGAFSLIFRYGLLKRKEKDNINRTIDKKVNNLSVTDNLSSIRTIFWNTVREDNEKAFEAQDLLLRIFHFIDYYFFGLTGTIGILLLISFLENDVDFVCWSIQLIIVQIILLGLKMVLAIIPVYLKHKTYEFLLDAVKLRRTFEKFREDSKSKSEEDEYKELADEIRKKFRK